MSLGFYINSRRKALKYSQEYVAEQLGVSRQAVSKWETNQSQPSMDHLIRLADLLDSDLTELTSPEKYKVEQQSVQSLVEQSQKDIKMQLAAVFGRILTLVSFLGYLGAYSDEYELGDWYPRLWWGSLFLLGLVFTWLGSRDYFHRKHGSKKIIWLDLLFAFSIVFYHFLPFEGSLNTLITLLVGTLIIILQNIEFFIPVWRKQKSSEQ